MTTLGQIPSLADFEQRHVGPLYQSPERVATGTEDARGDIFSLGATLYHALTGAEPTVGHTMADMLAARQAGRRPPPPRELCSDIPTDLSDFTMQLMAPVPEDRPSNCQDIIASLTAFHKAAKAKEEEDRIGQRRVTTTSLRPEDSGENTTTEMQNSVKTAQSEQRAVKTVRKKGRQSKVINVLLGLSLFLLAVLLWRYSQGSRPGLDRPTLSSSPMSGRRQRTPAPLPEPQATPAVDGNSSQPIQPELPSEAAAATRLAELRHSRPQPGGLAFRSAKGLLRDHFSQITGADLLTERKRLGYIIGSLEYLVVLLGHTPFNRGVKTTVHLQDGTSLAGTVLSGNENGITVTTQAASGGMRDVPWNELAFEQFVDFFEFYLQMRVSQQDTVDTGGISPLQEQHVAEDCLRLALLCDWYGNLSRARHYAKQAVIYDPSRRPEVMRLLPGMADAP